MIFDPPRWLSRLLTVFLLLAWPAAAQEPAPVTGTLAGWQWEFAPGDQPYPGYIADPRRPRMYVGAGLFDSEIPGTSGSRSLLDAGTRYTLLQLHPVDGGGHEFSVDVEGGLFTRFDIGNKLNSVGWDGVLGAFAVYDWQRSLALRLGMRHLSAHIGDEYSEVTGRRRIGYTRSSLNLGMAWQGTRGWTVYFEPSWAYGMGNEERQRRWGLEGGMQYQGPLDRWWGRAATYAGLHLRSLEESDWDPGVSAHAGLLVKRLRGGGTLRLGLEAYRGPVVLGEFSLDYDESYLIAGLTLDFY